MTSAARLENRKWFPLSLVTPGYTRAAQIPTKPEGCNPITPVQPEKGGIGFHLAECAADGWRIFGISADSRAQALQWSRPRDVTPRHAGSRATPLRALPVSASGTAPGCQWHAAGLP